MATQQTVKPRDVVLQTLRFEEPPVCPCYAWVDPEMIEPLAAHFGPDAIVCAGLGPSQIAGSYTAMCEIRALPVSEDGERHVDEFGSEFRSLRGAALHLERPALAEPTLKGYRFPDLTGDEHFRGLDAWIDVHADRFRIVQLGMLFFERSWWMRGMENILMDLCLHPSFTHALFDGLEAVCAGVIDRLLRDYGDRIDAIGLSDDYGSERNLMISPDHWRTFLKPRLRRLYQRIRAGGKQVYMHSCGHVRPIVPDLVEIGGNMLQPIQPEAMDIFELKQTFGRDLCLVGGISTQRTLPFGTPDEVRAEVRACLRRMAPGGGYIMAPAKPVMPGVPIENAAALIDAFTHQDR